MPRNPEINSKIAFLAFMKTFAAEANRDAATWENNTIESYLNSMSAWLDDCDGFYGNNEEKVPSSVWQIIADMLVAGGDYE
jgi:hypothetical protein